MAAETRHRHRQSMTSILVVTLGMVTAVQTIDCYKCTSMDGHNPECEDDFNTDYSTIHLIQRDCHYGHFKGTHCTKLVGKKEDGTKMMVRDCSDADWGSHCGDIKLRLANKDGVDTQQIITGCLEACHKDGCNLAIARTSPSLILVSILCLVIALVVTFLCRRYV